MSALEKTNNEAYFTQINHDSRIKFKIATRCKNMSKGNKLYFKLLVKMSSVI